MNLNQNGNKNPNWKGGLPTCLDCGKRLSNYQNKRCSRHSAKYSRSVKKWASRFKDGRYSNPEYISWLKNRHGVIKKSAMGSHTFDEWLGLKNRFNLSCLSCGKKEPEIKLTEDHVVPLSRGGEDSIDNIQPLCKTCNLKKFTKETDFRPLRREVNMTDKVFMFNFIS